MIKEKVENAINDQINAELYSAYLYLSIEAYFSDCDLDGFASWMHAQAQEEVEHAMRFFDYLNERGGRVELGNVEKPKKEWNSALDAFEDAYEHEQYISKRIDELCELAEGVNDRPTINMLQWFVEEQVEEEDSVGGIVEKLRMVDGKSTGLLMLDSKLGERETE